MLPASAASAASAASVHSMAAFAHTPMMHHHQLMHQHVEPPRPRMLFRVPRVVPNQREKYESDDIMKKHTRESEVRYTGFRDRSLHERQAKFIQSLREGRVEVAFVSTGFNLLLSFDSFPRGFRADCSPTSRVDFHKEPGKVHIRSPFILNGVCVRWKGYLDLEHLDGAGTLEFDEESAKTEDGLLREQVEAYNRRLKEFEEHRKMQQRQIALIMGQHQQAMAAAAAAAMASATSMSSVESSSFLASASPRPDKSPERVPNLEETSSRRKVAT